MATTFYIESGTGRMVSDPSQFVAGHSYTSSGTGQVVQGPSAAPVQSAPAQISAPATNSFGQLTSNYTPTYGATNVGTAPTYTPGDLTSMQATLTWLGQHASTPQDYQLMSSLQTQVGQEQSRQAAIKTQAQNLINSGAGSAQINQFYASLPAKDQPLVQPIIGSKVTSTNLPNSNPNNTLSVSKGGNTTTANMTPVTLGNGQSVYVDNQGNYFDAQGNTLSGQQIAGATAGTGQVAGTAALPSGITSTGNANYDALLSSAQQYVQSQLAGGSTINPNISITPALVAQFLQEAHSVADPYYQQQVSAAVQDINSNLNNLTTQFQNNQGQALQNFGVQLASQDNSAAGNGTAFSGQRNLADQNLVNTTNRSLASNAANAQYSIGSLLRQGAGNVGAANAGQFSIPSLTSAQVSSSGGQYGSNSPSNSLNFSYDPSTYQTGTLTSQYNTNLVNQSNQFLKNYLSKAANATTATPSFQDLTNSGKPTLIGGSSGLM